MFWSVWRMIETLARASTHSETHTNFVHAMAPTGAAALWWLCDRDECTPQQIGRSRGARAQFYHLRIAVVIVEFLKIRSVVGSRIVSVGCVCVCVWFEDRRLLDANEYWRTEKSETEKIQSNSFKLVRTFQCRAHRALPLLISDAVSCSCCCCYSVTDGFLAWRTQFDEKYREHIIS